jgi:hypothetical protein
MFTNDIQLVVKYRWYSESANEVSQKIQFRLTMIKKMKGK